MDDVCITNSNRQIHAFSDTIGRPKVEVSGRAQTAMELMRQVAARCDFVTVGNAEEIVAEGFDVIVDAIDAVGTPMRLIDARRRLYLWSRWAVRVDGACLGVSQQRTSPTAPMTVR